MIGVGDHSSHLLLLHQQRFGQLPVDVIKHQPLPPDVVDTSAQNLIAGLGLIVLVIHLLQSVFQNADLLLGLQSKESVHGLAQDLSMRVEPTLLVTQPLAVCFPTSLSALLS